MRSDVFYYRIFPLERNNVANHNLAVKVDTSNAAIYLMTFYGHLDRNLNYLTNM